MKVRETVSCAEIKERDGPHIFSCICVYTAHFFAKNAQTDNKFYRRKTMYVWRNIQARSCNHCCCGKAINVTYSECVSVALVVQHAKRMRRIILTYVACMAVPYFSTLSHKRQEYRKKKKSYRTQNACFHFLYNFCLKIFSFCEELGDILS